MTVIALPHARLPRIAVLGAGHVGPVIARVAIEAGYQVSIAASGDPEKIELIVQVLAPGAEPRWAAEAVEEADLVYNPVALSLVDWRRRRLAVAHRAWRSAPA
jgi:predicted dinucleotide-binding enzyme